jgi:hypothetical protein
MGVVPRGAGMDKDVDVTLGKSVSKSLRAAKADEKGGPFSHCLFK